MSKRESIARYNLIIQKLRRSVATFDEIANYLQIESDIQSYDYNISKRTFQRDLEDIRSIFNIDIQYDFSGKFYYIASDDQPDMNVRIMEAFDTFQALNLSERLSSFIHFENRPPKGTEYLHGILHAIRNRRQVSFIYQKFWEDKPAERKADPYALKEFRSRWYMVARDHKDNVVKTFSLDRFIEFEILKAKFDYPKDYDVNEKFRHCFGIITPDNPKPVDIILSFDSFQGKYAKTLPLHSSQKIIKDTEDELQIKLTLCITHDFIMELLSMGENMKVLKPASLMKLIKNEHEKAARIYE